MRIHPTAIIEEGATLGANCEVAAYAVIKRGAILGDNVFVDHHAVVGGDPQAVGFDRSISSGVRIGAGAQIREGVTIHRSMQSDGFTEVGEQCFLMANSHVGHDAQVGAHTIMANGVLLAGHVSVGQKCFLGGGAVFHQNIRIGESAMVSGNAQMSLEIPPFVIAHERNAVSGLNLVGLKRRGLNAEVIADLKHCYKAVYFAPGPNLRKKAQACEARTEFGQVFLNFFEEGKRGFVKAES